MLIDSKKCMLVYVLFIHQPLLTIVFSPLLMCVSSLRSLWALCFYACVCVYVRERQREILWHLEWWFDRRWYSQKAAAFRPCFCSLTLTYIFLQRDEKSGPSNHPPLFFCSFPLLYFVRCIGFVLLFTIFLLFLLFYFSSIKTQRNQSAPFHLFII